ncbi:MAG: tRNA (guanine(46)-N(7))-methyltransferase TrmB [Rickettsiales bacterium]|jgi:tRNA (guanine-N7-)-methyltransferase|nr:tRNA (guanine(46)-N(7))-methyltransferase TrmB [Rickettsiales bacterium]
MAILDNRKNLRSFGRINGRAMGLEGQHLLMNVLPGYLINPGELRARNEVNYLEIGFGYGESLIRRALDEQSANHIGCEVYSRGVVNLLGLILARGVENIRIFNGDARIFLEEAGNEYFDEIFVLFPDPWPKRKQMKKRIVDGSFLELTHRKLKTGGAVFFATDSEDYAKSILSLMDNSRLFGPVPANPDECRGEPAWWIETRYQEKAKKSGRETFFIEGRTCRTI